MRVPQEDQHRGRDLNSGHAETALDAGTRQGFTSPTNAGR